MEFTGGTRYGRGVEARYPSGKGEVCKTLRVAVFAPSGNLAPGSSHFSVLVQNPSTQEALLNAKIELTAESALTSPAHPSAATASHEGSDNKLLQAADLDLPTEGTWTLHLTVQREAISDDFALALRVVKPDAGSAGRWPYVVILLFAVTLLFVYVWRHRALGTRPFK